MRWQDDYHADDVAMFGLLVLLSPAWVPLWLLGYVSLSLWAHVQRVARMVQR